MKSKFLIGLAMVGSLLVVGAGAYYLGTKSTHDEASSIQDTPSQQLSKLESQLETTQSVIANQVAEVQNKVKTAKINLEMAESDYDFASQDIADRLAELDQEIALTQSKIPSSDVPVPAGSPDGLVLNQPKSPSGVPLEVLQNYEQETGVTAEEIEELMQRTE